MKHVDRVYIGTGPLCCIDAIYNRQKGYNVILLDEKTEIGGAWTTIKHNNLPPLEIGCHIWSIDKLTYRFIERFLNIKLIRLAPQPVLLKNNREIPYDWKMNVISFKRMINNIFNFQLKQIISDFRDPGFRFSFWPSKYIYPVKGATSFINSIRNKLNENKIPIQLKTKIKTAEVLEKEIRLYFDDEYIACKKLYITSLSGIEKFEFFNGFKILPEFKLVNYIHMHIVLNANFKRPFSYIRFLDDNIIHRVSDITYQAEEQISKDKKILLIGIYQNAYDKYSKDELTAKVLQKLKNHNYLDNKVKALSSFLNVYPSYYNNPETLKNIENASGGKIKFLASTDLIYGLSKQREKWEKLFFANTE
jgi:hypothetical protein